MKLWIAKHLKAIVGGAPNKGDIERYFWYFENTINNRFASILESKQDEAYDNGYDNGYDSGYKEGGWLKVKSSKCHKELNFDIHDKKDNAMILKFLDYQFHHVECPNANSLRDNTSITVPATLTHPATLRTQPYQTIIS